MSEQHLIDGDYCRRDCEAADHMEWVDDDLRVVVRTPDFGEPLTLPGRVPHVGGVRVSLPSRVTGVRWSEEE